MTTSTVSTVRPPAAALLALRARWTALSVVAQTRVRVTLLIGATLLAYHYTLSSLIQTINYDTPLAYIGLVPLIALGLAFVLAHRTDQGPDIHDRQLDYIIGLPLIAIAMAMEEILPAHQSVFFWIRRMDLLSLPMFVAGAVTLLFGTRTLWKQRVPILYLLLAWPWPYTTILLGGLNGFTTFTVDALTQVLKVVHLGAPVHAANGEQGLFQVFHGANSFPVSVVTACSGVDGMVGFLLVGFAFAVIVQGPRARKALWLLCGIGLLWITNVGRLVLIFWAGNLWGENVALNVLHPVAGLIIFNIGVILMMVLLRPFGLSIFTERLLTSSRPGGGPPPEGGKPGRRRAPQPFFFAATLVAVVGMVLAVNNNSFKAFDLVATASGEPKLDSFLIHPAAPQGWSSQFETEYTANKTLFGNSSRWWRYYYYDSGRHGGDLSAPFVVTADVINAANVQGFGAYGVEACYDFHGYTLRDVSNVSLGGGIEGQTLTFTTPSDGSWSVVYWIWPVKTGSETRYERVILYLLNGSNEPLQEIHYPKTSVSKSSSSLNPKDSADQALIVNRQFLIDFAQEIVHNQAQIVESSTLEISQATPYQDGIDYVGRQPVNSGSGVSPVKSRIGGNQA
jgi:exosortase/archaeosortase family protein